MEKTTKNQNEPAKPDNSCSEKFQSIVKKRKEQESMQEETKPKSKGESTIDALYELDVFRDDMPTPEAVVPRLKLKKTPKFVPPVGWSNDKKDIVVGPKLGLKTTNGVFTLTREETEPPVLSNKKVIPKPVVTEELDDLGDVKSKRDLMNIASFILKQNILPSCFKTQNEIFIALQTVFSLGIKNPGEMLLALNNMYLINNKIELFGDLPLALVKRFGDLLKIEEFFVDAKHEKICMANKNLNNLPMAAVCNLTNSLGDTTEFYLTENDLKLSGGTRNTDGSWNMRGSATWKRYPKIHWARRLRGWALKSSYPHVLKGVGIHEYDNTATHAKKITLGKTNAYTIMEEKYTDKKDD